MNAEESTEQILGLVDNNVETDKQVNTLIENEKRLAIKWHLDKLCIKYEFYFKQCDTNTVNIVWNTH